MPSQSDRIESIVELLHEAAFDDTRWLAAASLMSEVSQSRGNVLAFGAGSSAIDTHVFFARFCFDGEDRHDWARRYFRDRWDRDESIPRLLWLPHGQLVPTGDLYTDAEKKTSGAYHERLRRGWNDGLHVRLDGPEGCHIAWAVGNSRDKGGWGADQIGVIEQLVPHVRQFVQVRAALADAGALTASLAELLDNSRLGVIHLDRRRRIAGANDVALGLLREGNALYDAEGYLRVPERAPDDELQRLLARAVPSFGEKGVGGSMFLRRPSASVSLVLHVNPVRAVDRPGHFQPRGVAALVLVTDPVRRARIDPDRVAGALDLTPAESRVAVALAAGQTVSEIAEETGRTKGMIRWHVQNIFRKQNISSQTELVRRVLSLHGFTKPRS